MVVPRTGIEPVRLSPTDGFLVRCVCQFRHPGSINITNGAGDGNRTHVISLEGWSSTIELHPQTNNKNGAGEKN